MIMWLKRAIAFGLTTRSMFFLVLLSLLTTIAEVFGLGMFFPIFQFIQEEGNINSLIESSFIWKEIIDLSTVLNINITLGLLLFAAFSFFIMRQVLIYIRVVYTASISYRITMKLRNQMFKHYINADMNFYDKFSIGNLVNAMTTEMTSAIIGIMAPLGFVSMLIMGFIYTILLLFISWEMTVIVIVVLLIVIQAPRVWIQESKIMGRDLAGVNTSLSEFLVSRLKSPRLVRLSGMGTNESYDFVKLTKSQYIYSLQGTILSSRTEGVMEPLVIGLSFIFLFVSYNFFNIGIEIIGLYLVIMVRITPLVKGLVLQWQRIKRYIGSIEVVEDRINTMRQFKEKSNGNKKLLNCKKGIYFEKVYYKYFDSNTCALNNITLEFVAGECTALVGPSGSGKSTLIDLIPYIRKPYKGRVIIDNDDISVFDLKSLRSGIAYVSQSAQIFKGSIINHIKYGSLNASQEEVLMASKLAGSDDFIKDLPDQYDTMLDEDGVNLSGGQRQRLDIARALVEKSTILILDEPTSGLDFESRVKLKSSLDSIRLNTNITIIIVTHDLPSIVDADKIVILNSGKIEAMGKHDKLICINDWYNEACKIKAPSHYR